MTRENYRIFSEGRIAGLSLKNRLIRSATAEGRAAQDGRILPGILELYQDLAQGGVGMIITGHMAVMQGGRAGHNQTGIWDDTFVPEIAAIADQVHTAAGDCRIIGQVSHCGRQVLRGNDEAACVGPSDVASPLLEKKARALTLQEIEEIVDCFAGAIVRIKKAGFDGAQLHAAHGWLLSSFLSPYTNRRTDEYGGSLENRTRIVREIVARAREEVGGFPILIKINGDDQLENGIDIQSFPELAAEIEKAGVDAIEISGGMWDCLVRTEEELGFRPLPIPESRTRINTAESQSYFAQYAAAADVAIPLILVGGNKNVERLEEIMGRGQIDFFSFSRPLICEPDLPKRWLEGRDRESAECISCNTCLTTMQEGTACLLKQDREKHKGMQEFWTTAWQEIFK
ncbi:MAG: NADH:flavin oxidoreductase [Proteobacteria bacterium]|nr:NADH:flavin oxidoreductase [Pseudomonadota bacterium]